MKPVTQNTKFRKHYSAYVREILAEFMTKRELNDLDKKYTQAKIKRFLRKVEQQTK